MTTPQVIELSVTPIYAALLGLLLVYLSLRVISLRRRERTSLGHSGSAALERRVRAQANLAEYAPIGIMLVALLELSSFSPAILHAIGGTLLVGRVLHGWALSISPGSPLARTGGMALTLTAIIEAATLNLLHAWGSSEIALDWLQDRIRDLGGELSRA